MLGAPAADMRARLARLIHARVRRGGRRIPTVREYGLLADRSY
jgi:hypothetical protein